MVGLDFNVLFSPGAASSNMETLALCKVSGGGGGGDAEAPLLRAVVLKDGKISSKVVKALTDDICDGTGPSSKD